MSRDVEFPRQATTSIVAHPLVAVATFAVLRHSSDILGWLTWEVSSWFGKSAGMHFFSLGISVDSRFGEVATGALVIAVPLLLLGGIAESIERMRRRVGPAALVLAVLIEGSGGAALWSVTGHEEASLLEAGDPGRLPRHPVPALDHHPLGACWRERSLSPPSSPPAHAA